MSNQIILKKSSVAAKTPLATDLVYGELALNYADGKLYYKKSDNTIDSFAVASNFATASHTHSYLPLSGGTMTGVITTPNGTHGIAIGDDSRLADRNVANTLFIEGAQNNDRGYINFSSTTGNTLGAVSGGALTWNNNTVWHAGNDGSGSGLDADTLDGQDGSYYKNWYNLTNIPANLTTEYTYVDSLAPGWYTIAVNSGSRASAKFIIADTTSGLHQTVHFYASHHYGSGNNISILHNDWYGGGGPIRYIRIKEGGTYDGCLLQIYIDSWTYGLRIYMYEDVQSTGFEIKSFVADGTDPGGTTNFTSLVNEAVKIDLDLAATVMSHEIYIGGATTQYKALHAGNYNSYALPITGGTITGSITIEGNTSTKDYLRITNTSGTQRLVMGNQDSSGANNPTLIGAANGNIYFGNGNSWAGDGGTATWHSNFNSGGLGLGLTTGASYRLHVNGTGYATSDFRTPIFYDSADTSFYCDPNSTTRLYHLQVDKNATSDRDKIRLWNTSDYSIGMQAGIAYGGLDDWGMTFQFSDNNTRGFWWGDSAHSTAQGAMALTTNGKLTVAHSVRIGFGESDTTTPGSIYGLEVNGSIFGNSIETNVVVLGSKIRTSVISGTLSNNTTTSIDSWAINTYRSGLYQIQLTQGTKYQFGEFRVIHDGTNTYITEFSILENSTIGSGTQPIFTATISAGILNLNILIDNASTTNVTYIIEKKLYSA